MPRYIVKGTTIVHAKKGDKGPREYKPGQEIELPEEEAAPLKRYLEQNAQRSEYPAEKKGK